MNWKVLAVGFILTASLVVVLYFALGNDPQHIDSPLVGRVAPDFALKAVGSGQTLALSGYRGKPVILNFCCNGDVMRQAPERDGFRPSARHRSAPRPHQ